MPTEAPCTKVPILKASLAALFVKPSSMIPQSLGMLATQNWFRKLTDRIGSHWIVLTSLIITVLGTIPFAFADGSTNQVLLAAALLIRGAGIGGLYIPIMASAYIGIEGKQVPDASTATRILQTIVGAFGPAILATVIQAGPSGSGSIQCLFVVDGFRRHRCYSSFLSAVA